MRDQKHAAAIGLQKFFEPFDHPDVQMVRRLIQKEKVRLTQESLRKTDARRLPAREMADILLEFLLGEAESKRHAADAAFKVIAVHRLEPRHEIPIRGKFLRAGIPCRNRVLHPLLFRAEHDEVGERASQLLVERIVGE